MDISKELDDILEKNLKVVFCGTNPGEKSIRERYHYADPTNIFWETLMNIGLIPDKFDPEKYNDLKEYNIGITDLLKNRIGPDPVECNYKLFELESISLKNKIIDNSPLCLAFNGKCAPAIIFNRDRNDIGYGLQPENRKINETWTYVLPTTSWNGRRHFNDNKKYWDELPGILEKLKK